MTDLITIGRETEILKLRVKRRELLLKECSTKSQSNVNLKHRLNTSAKLFSLTSNPIYIHF